MPSQLRRSLISRFARGGIILGLLSSASSQERGDCSSCVPAEKPEGPRTAEDALDLLQSTLNVEAILNAGLFSSSQVNATHAEGSQIPNKTKETAATATGVSFNEEGDLGSFVAGTVSNLVMMLMCVGFFLFARYCYSDVYEWELTQGLSLEVEVSEGRWFDWARRSLKVTVDEVQDSAGLDQAMLLEFTHLGMRIMAVVGIPMFFMGLMNWGFGGNAAGKMYLSYLSFGNVEDGNWLYWVHCFVVWGVVFCVQVCVYRSMELFMVQRIRWLKELPEAQANTIMVEGIPEEMQSDVLLKAHIEKIWGPGKVKSASVVKVCPELTALCQQKETLKLTMERAKNVESKGQAAPVSVQEIQSEIATVTRNIEGERKKVLAEAATPGVLTSGTGFVTFFERSDAETTAVAHYSHDVDEWIVSLPPPPEAIVWKNLQQSETMKEAKELLAYALVACLYMLYLPMVIWISQIATKINMGPLQPLWGAVAPTLGLQFMVAFLPTFLILIFSLCYPLPDYTEAQQMLQNWYFIFQMVFVILVAGIGSSLRDFMVAIATEPVSSFLILGTTLPAATHFYMNFVVLQWTTHTTNLCRVVQLSKYWFLLRLYEPDQAKALSEPEDQDYYGIGSRSARFTTNLCIGIVFGTLCPWINLLVFINFAICRVVYGYLICFAETRKADLGGKFWVHQLKHIFVGNMIYCILMAGVLFGRSDSKVPGIIAVASLFYVFRSYNRFNKRYAWERLTMPEVVTQRRTPKVVSGAKFTYLQPEFVDQ